MIGQAPPTTAPDQRNGRAPAPVEAPPGRASRLHATGYWIRWSVSFLALLALLNALVGLLLFVAGQVPVALWVYLAALAIGLSLVAVLICPPLTAPPTGQRLEAEDRLRHSG